MQKTLQNEDFAKTHEAAADAASAIGEATARRDPVRWLIACGILLIAAIAIGTAVTIGNFRERGLESSERELENTVLLLARHFDQQLGDLTVVQNDLAALARTATFTSPDFFKRYMSTHETHLMMKAKVSGSSDVSAVNVYDASGALINSSETWPAPAINIADRAYFEVLKSVSASTPYQIELVRSRFTGGLVTIVARKMTGPNGEFLGVATRGLAPAKFEDFFSSVTLGKEAAISMFDQDGAMLARYPHVEELIGLKLKTAPLFRTIMSGTDHNTSRITSPVDGQERLVSVHKLSRFPISVVATTTVASALADWRNQTKFLIASAILSALVIAGILFLIVKQLSRQHQTSRKQLTLEKLRLDTAVNNMTQGLTLFDETGRLDVCNQRYIAMYGLSPDIVKPGCNFRDLMAHRLDIGSMEGEIDLVCSTILRDMALNRTIIRRTPDGRSIQITYRQVDGSGWVATHEDITDRKQSEDRVAYLAHYDALTALPNRVLFQDRLQQELRKIQNGEQIALLYIDIDEFKSVNDSLGHPVGDELLKGVALRLSRCIGEADLIARLGGDEFAIVQTGIQTPADVTDLASRIYEAIRDPFECLGHQLVTDVSIGIAIAPRDASESDRLLMKADVALYGAKADGRRTYRFFEPGMDARAKARLTLQRDLRQAMTDGGFEVQYQPVVNLSSNEVTGCEALLRWHHPQRGMVSPAEFIPVAEDTGLISQLGEWVLKTACAEAATWPDHLKVAVNVSPVQFRSPIFGLKVAAALSASGLAANRLELEITEAVLIRDDEAALTILHELRALGVRIALDDFGTGYSSLSYLQRFPFDKIKIDRCFVNDIAEADGSSAIVSAVVNIAEARSMTTTAEGVETEQQRQLLHVLGCTEMQGYLFSRPRPVAEIRTLLSQSKRHETA
jgi:diguanylate cyclase (GGDEF)-like protein/PAS domain S-box-containing protein